MQDKLLRKGIALIIIILFIGMDIVPSAGTIIEKKITMPTSNNNIPPIAIFIWEPEIPDPGEIISFRAKESFDPDGYITLYEWDWDNNGVYDESHTIPTATHSWNLSGEYQVTLRVTDNESLTGTKTNTVIVNYCPEIPTIDGPTEGVIRVEYNYTFHACDPDGDNIYYECIIYSPPEDFWEEIGPYPSCTNGTITFAFKHLGSTSVLGRTIDVLGQTSEWAELRVHMPRNKIVNNKLLLRYFEQFPILWRFLLRITDF